MRTERKTEEPIDKTDPLVLYTRMIRLTQKEKINWVVADQDMKPSLIGDDKIDGTVLIATYKGKRIRLYIKKFQRRLSNLAAQFEGKLYDWSSEAVLEVVDEAGNTLYKFEQSKALHDLYRVAQYQVADVSGFIDAVMAEEVS